MTSKVVCDKCNKEEEYATDQRHNMVFMEAQNFEFHLCKKCVDKFVSWVFKKDG